MTLPLGYRYATGYAGLRLERKDDLALIVSEPVASAAAMFTTNVVRAAPVKLAQRHLQSSGGKVRAVLINAGNANCATRTGERAARECCRALARLLRAPAHQILPASTGVIGAELDASRITRRLPELVQSLAEDRFEQLAAAIMTTDTVPKFITAEAVFQQGRIRVAGVTKGAGMIQPNMATMLAFITTDAPLAPASCDAVLRSAVKVSFNRITVDSDTSTNDACILMASGAEGGPLLEPGSEGYTAVAAAITEVATALAHMVVRDGEGATKFVAVTVRGALTEQEAEDAAFAIANSPLVKTALFGQDANWGRVAMAVGKSQATVDPDRLEVIFAGITTCRHGTAVPFDEAEAARALAAPEIDVVADLHLGAAEATVWTCDFSYEYVRINGEYRS